LLALNASSAVADEEDFHLPTAAFSMTTKIPVATGMLESDSHASLALSSVEQVFLPLS